MCVSFLWQRQTMDNLAIEITASVCVFCRKRLSAALPTIGYEIYHSVSEAIQIKYRDLEV